MWESGDIFISTFPHVSVIEATLLMMINVHILTLVIRLLVQGNKEIPWGHLFRSAEEVFPKA